MTPPAGAPGHAARSEIGPVRAANEDRFLARPPLFAVADGMGGHAAGEVAAGLAVTTLDGLADRTGRPEPGPLADALREAHARIQARAATEPELRGMGTTATVVWLAAHRFVVGHVGDSRAYLLREGRLRQVTDDHSVVGALVRSGALTPEAAAQDGRRNLLTRALGVGQELRPDVLEIGRQPGDRLLLCTDGLTGALPDDAIGTILRAEEHAADAAARLVNAALAAGAQDNVTAVVVDPDRCEVAAPAAQPGRRGSRRGAIGLLAAAIVLGGAWLILALRGDGTPGQSPVAPQVSPSPSPVAPTAAPTGATPFVTPAVVPASAPPIPSP